jgi:hypothetical protein
MNRPVKRLLQTSTEKMQVYFHSLPSTAFVRQKAVHILNSSVPVISIQYHDRFSDSIRMGHLKVRSEVMN